MHNTLTTSARAVTGIRKFDRGLDIVRPTALARRSRPGSLQACSDSSPVSERPRTPYLSEHCIPVSRADTRRHLRSANRHLLAVPRFRLNTSGRRAFSVAGPMARDSLLDFIRDPTSSTEWLFTENVLVCALLVRLAHQGFLTIMRYTNPLTHSLTHLLTH